MGSSSPSLAPVSSAHRSSSEDSSSWTHFDNSVHAVSFGFVATAVLISMFIVMAVYERFLRPRSPTAGGRNPGDLQSQMMFSGKLTYPSPKMMSYAKEVSILMPGDEVPSFIANPAPAPCHHEPISRPLHDQEHHILPDMTSRTLPT